MEYKDYISFLKEYVGLDRCAFFNNVVHDKTSANKHISIEIHHDPLTLYDIVEIVLCKYEAEGLEIDEFDIADEVMELHYNNMIGLIPLSKTAHQLAHNSNKAPIPLTLIYGRYAEFLRIYEAYVPEEIYDKIERRAEETENMTEDTFEAIRQDFEYVKVNGYEPISKMEINNVDDVELELNRAKTEKETLNAIKELIA
jgi:hypothetical protein